MAFRYKMDVIAALKDRGYTTYKMRKDKVIGEKQLQEIRNGELVSISILSKLCELLDSQPGDIIEYVREVQSEKSKRTARTNRTAATCAKAQNNRRILEIKRRNTKKRFG